MVSHIAVLVDAINQNTTALRQAGYATKALAAAFRRGNIRALLLSHSRNTSSARTGGRSKRQGGCRRHNGQLAPMRSP